MRSRLALTLALSAAMWTTTGAQAQKERCGTRQPGLEEAEQIEVRVSRARKVKTEVTIPVWVHVINKGGGFANGDVPEFEPEIAEELFARRDYVNPAEGKFAEADGLGAWLNLPELDRDADRRVRMLKDTMATLVDGRGVAIGVAPLVDLGHPREAVAAMVLQVDGPSVLTEVAVGRLDDEAAREQRRALREPMRRMQLGGKQV